MPKKTIRARKRPVKGGKPAGPVGAPEKMPTYAGILKDMENWIDECGVTTARDLVRELRLALLLKGFCPDCCAALVPGSRLWKARERLVAGEAERAHGPH